MDDTKKNQTAATSATGRESVVCAYACIPEWPEQPAATPFAEYHTTVSTFVPEAGRVKEIVGEIECLSKAAGKAESIAADDRLAVTVGPPGTDSPFGLLLAPADTEIAIGIVELIKGYYDTEIEKLENELDRLLGIKK